MDSLFPDLPEDLNSLSDQEQEDLLREHQDASALIVAEDESFLKNLTADQIVAEHERGVEQAEKLVNAILARAQEQENYNEKKTTNAEKLAEAVARLAPVTDSDPGDETEEVAEAPVEVTAEVEETSEETDESEDSEEAVVEERELVTAAVEPVRLRRSAPAPAPERQVKEEPQEKGTALVASAQFQHAHPEPLNQDSLAHLMREVAIDLGAVAHDGKMVQRVKVDPWQVDVYPDGRRVEIGGGEMVWDGPKTKVARAQFDFPEERTLNGSDDYDKIRAVLPDTVQFLGKPGGHGGEALVASGGLCAPLTPFYSMPNFASQAEPVWDSFPVFNAVRGGVNVPTATGIADITTAISSISEANDDLGGTFATKSCQDLTCPAYTETAVNIFAHCRQYGNLNARAWPEKIAHENALTMAALVRTSESFMLDRIKSFFPNTTNGATTLALSVFLVEAIVQYRFGVIGRFRMPLNTRFRALLPYYVPDLLMLDNHATPFDRYKSKESLVDYLRSVGIDPVFYQDSPSTGDSQLPDATQAAGAQDETPTTIQWAIYPEGAVLGIDSGSLELGIVRDSTLNETNDFQVFGERFRNVALIAPAQTGWWVTTTYCAGGQLPPAGTALDCPS